MRERLFRFKQFSVLHEKSAMKVGADAVLLGSWVDLENCRSALDVGCGCGIISLMMAQRSETTFITAIDIDSASVNECELNFRNSLWNSRLEVYEFNYLDFCDKCRRENILYDHVVSNPPYYDSGVNVDFTDSRVVARHKSELSPISLLTSSVDLLTENGKISVICPSFWYDKLIEEGEKVGLYLSRVLKVRGNYNAQFKRILLEFSKSKLLPDNKVLTMEIDRGVPTDEYKVLVEEFYLKL